MRNAVARRGPNQMGMGTQLPQQGMQGMHGQPGQQQQMGMPGQQAGQQGHMMGGQHDPNAPYDPNQMQQQGMQPGQQPGQAQPGHQVSFSCAQSGTGTGTATATSSSNRSRAVHRLYYTILYVYVILFCELVFSYHFHAIG